MKNKTTQCRTSQIKANLNKPTINLKAKSYNCFLVFCIFPVGITSYMLVLLNNIPSYAPGVIRTKALPIKPVNINPILLWSVFQSKL